MPWVGVLGVLGYEGILAAIGICRCFFFLGLTVSGIVTIEGELENGTSITKLPRRVNGKMKITLVE